MNFPTESYVPEKTSRPMTATEKVVFAFVWPAIAPLILAIVAFTLVGAYFAILVMGHLPVNSDDTV